ncbi:nucleotide sugar dehydrogenase family protein [Yersinia pseudotuberculosis IP 32953]|uniref:UDP-N-acetyl-D-mannosamine dehydrogenase n=1 Tax=Yersinia pseudotuberculosis serotype I (strain IP32953) TaxID=273123 RepID=Q66G13_YERPS|nr:UDP-N-acetyl-D-mannosamine dehydrogenase [Yersinia pseudotuberculosis]CQD57911.1 UDP-N-acetyl-D-mannosamine dehydrogenase [Yersinia intermedia]AJJ03580.1 nucleotide sugar dehydrogenase family protein [Yersinia pseudotuberculosis]AJJ54385.1 nucleotide sugar dehydrogenase family protein [Yersinia pseudotuberculosis IP 32953]AJJ66096.1 nucleotide sugar dehydrogenase family protein [Yersinia pseudotuberculosis PB1/+]AJJ73329.1 nucleotide sugar dehydrogenase family protein [Yersinia pseudotuberc
MSFETISVIGLGYIGLPTAAAFASRKKKVIGVDVNAHAVETINRGAIHIVEPDLDKVVKIAVEGGYLQAATKPQAADAFLIAVPTPFKGDHEPDMIFVESAAKSIAPVLKKGDLVILESTSPVGATEQMAQWLAEARPDLSFPQQAGEAADINIAYCPERVLPGQVMVELIQNDRVIGGMTPKCSARASALYKIFLEGECVVTNSRTAEMCKLTENSFRDVNIAFANELSLICDEQGINVWELIRLANRHPRVNILQPGPGVGGHCIAVDPWFIVSQNPQLARLIHTARLVNDGKPLWVVDRVKAAVADCLAASDKRASEVKIACFGLAFKPDIDDLRESPAVGVARLIAEWHVGETLVVEPNVEQLPKSLMGLVTLKDTATALQQADVLVMLVDHKQFKAIKPEDIKQQWIVDTKGVWR